MTKIAPADDAFETIDPRWAKIEEVGAEAIDICCRDRMSSRQVGIDLEAQTYKALDLLSRGGTLPDALACINAAHPFAHKVIAELMGVAQELADTEIEARASLLA